MSPNAAAPAGFFADAAWLAETPTLPSPDVMRWNSRRKEQLLNGIRFGLIDLDEACRRYALTLDEVIGWYVLVRKHGQDGLRATQTRRYRRQDLEDGDALNDNAPKNGAFNA